jgi:RimJ/RimL family protein N-acetyltransferase
VTGPSLPLRTARLRLDPLTPADASDVLRIYGDPDTWRHLPQGRFTRIETALEHIAASERSHREHGLGTWAVRVGQAGADVSLPVGTFIGAGGVRHLDGGGVWNLGYRLDRRAWGRGLATELAVAALAAAAEVGPQIPVTARVLTTNPASVAVLEKIGLTLVWEGVRADAAAASDGTAVLRRVYTDRALAPAALSWLVAHA